MNQTSPSYAVLVCVYRPRGAFLRWGEDRHHQGRGRGSALWGWDLGPGAARLLPISCFKGPTQAAELRQGEWWVGVGAEAWWGAIASQGAVHDGGEPRCPLPLLLHQSQPPGQTIHPFPSEITPPPSIL